MNIFDKLNVAIEKSENIFLQKQHLIFPYEVFQNVCNLTYAIEYF